MMMMNLEEERERREASLRPDRTSKRNAKL
jgi:hypothetical protein